MSLIIQNLGRGFAISWRFPWVRYTQYFHNSWLNNSSSHNFYFLYSIASRTLRSWDCKCSEDKFEKTYGNYTLYYEITGSGKKHDRCYEMETISRMLFFICNIHFLSNILSNDSILRKHFEEAITYLVETRGADTYSTMFESIMKNRTAELKENGLKSCMVVSV